MKNKKILLIWDRLGDYHRARWAALGQKIGYSNVFAADLGAADNLYKWENTDSNNPQYALLSDMPVNQPDKKTRINRFKALLRDKNIDVVCIPGYGRIEYIYFLIISKLRGIKVVLFAESWYGTNPVFNFLKGFFLNRLCHGFLVSGENAKTHFNKKLHIPAHKIKIGYSVVDNKHFAKAVSTTVQADVLLCVARFSPEKNLLTLVEAFKQSKLKGKFSLKLVGGGPLHQTLEQAIADTPQIQLCNWLSYAELPTLYAQAKLFILPSIFEPWGLVVNEAMAAGLPIIVSEQTGCAPDLVDAGNGYVFDAENPAQLVKILDEIATLPAQKLKEMGLRSIQKIAGFTPETWADRVLELAN